MICFVLFKVSSNVSQLRDLLLTQPPLPTSSTNHLSTNHLYRRFYNPLAVGNDLPPPKKHWMPEKAAFWGDQEPLSKVRTAPRGRGCGLFPTGAESSRAGKGAWEGVTWLARPGPSPLPQAHLVGRVAVGGRGQLEERLGGPGKPSWGRGTLPNPDPVGSG